MKPDKIELYLTYAKCIFSVISIILSIIIIVNSIHDLEYIFQPDDPIEIVEHCKILAFIHHDPTAGNANRHPYIAEVQYDDGDIGYIALDKYDYVTRKVNSDAMVINRKYLQKIKGNI
jgi:hypothetical protein